MNWQVDLTDLIRRLIGHPRILKPTPVPPMPTDWKLTYADLVAEAKAGKRASIGRAEMAWANEYERSLIPPGMRFPRKGDLYESIADQTVEYITAWAAPYSGGGTGTLFAGERVWVHSEPRDEKPIGEYTLPVEYRRVEERMVPASERTASKYGGFSLYFTTIELNTKFKLVGTAFEGDIP
ncbi:MAG TPA: hypothetical protein P5077_08345 [bacterium]|nr:hypothetical protein [bacterium]